jgi:DNA-binding transcriptional MerR regulator
MATSRFGRLHLMEWPPAPEDRAYQRTDEPGFVHAGVRYDGFADRPGLPAAVRRQIARWARATGTATPSQQMLAELPEREPVRDAVAEALAFDNKFLSSPTFEAIMSHLSDEEQRRILRPHAILGRDLVWPLRPHEAAAVLGSAVTDHKLRDWEGDGLIRPVRIGGGQYRGYFRIHLLQALLISHAMRHGWTKQRLKEALGLAVPPEPTAVDDLQLVRTMERDQRLAQLA